MRILFPMGGTGQRFREAGFVEPKPLIKARGKRLIDWARESYSEVSGLGNQTYITQSTQVSISITVGHRVILGPPPTRGPVETLYRCKDLLKTDEELLIADCDSFLDPKELKDALDVFRASKSDGGVTVIRSSDPHVSYARLGPGWWVEETREKDPFTEWSTTGPYWWRRARDFLLTAELALRDGVYHVSPCYNYLLHVHQKVKAVPVQSFHHLGTPEALAAFETAGATEKIT